MKLFPRIAAALALVVAALAAAAPANAAIVHLGNVTINQHGSTGNSAEAMGASSAYGYVDGYLPSNSMITFTYNTAILPAGTPQALGSNTSLSGNVLTMVVSVDGVNSGSSFQISPVFMPTTFVPPSSWPVLTIVGPNTAIIKNLSASASYFSSYFLSLFNGALSDAASTYTVSSVPLPPALLLMIASMAGLGGLAARKKSVKAA